MKSHFGEIDLLLFVDLALAADKIDFGDGDEASSVVQLVAYPETEKY